MGLFDILTNIFNMGESKRRSRLNVGISFWQDSQPWYYSNVLSPANGGSLPDTIFGTDEISPKNKMVMLRRIKEYLAMRSIESLTPQQRERLDQRYSWNKSRPAKNLLDYFTALKYSYSSLLPVAHRLGDVDLVVSEKGKARVADIARSHSIWLDPIDAPKELYKYRLRINDCIAWAYDTGLVPIMATFTIPHVWNDLDKLLEVLRKSWSVFFSGSRHRKRSEAVGLEGYVRRLEITINEFDVNFETGEVTTGHGWHPHFHAILFVDKDKLETLSDMESEWRSIWSEVVCKQFENIVGNAIPDYSVCAMQEHGLWFSRRKKGLDEGKLLPVKDSIYLAKIMGYDPGSVYGVDKELTTATLKNSTTLFDLLCDKVTASNGDLICEYAIATKGVAAFTFSQGLEDRVKKHFETFPDRKPSASKCPAEKLVATIRREVYQILYRNALIPQLLKVAAQGYDVLCAWLRSVYVELGVPQFCDDPFALPRPPT